MRIGKSRPKSLGWAGTLMAGALLAGLPATAQGPGPDEAASPRIVLDLAKTPAGVATRMPLPRGRMLLTIANRVPSATYRLRYGSLDGRTERQYVAELGGPIDFSFKGIEPDQFLPKELEAACETWGAALKDFVREARETAIPERLARLEAAAAGSSCSLAGLMGDLGSFTVGHFGRLPIPVGGRAVVAVERLDASGAVLAGWQLELEGPDREPEWGHANEEEWIVSQVLDDVARLIQFSKRGAVGSGQVLLSPRAPRGPGGRYGVGWRSAAWRPAEAELSLADHVWDPRGYAPVASAWLADARLRPRSRGELPALVPRLTSPDPRTLRVEAQRLSEALANAPLDPGVHEHAAFVLGAAAWREHAGRYSDVRPALNGMAAHLALGLALRGRAGSATPEGRIARVMVDVLAGRGASTQAALDELRATLSQQAERVWIEALSRRAELVAPSVEPGPEASSLVRLEFERGRRAAGGESALLDLLDGRKTLTADSTRILMADLDAGVEAGNVYAEGAVDLELAEARELLSLESAELSAIAPAVREALDVAGGRLGPGPRPTVASRGFWAAGIERHLLAITTAHGRHLAEVLGLEQDGRRLARTYADWLAPLPLSPLMVVRLAAEGSEAGPCGVAQRNLLAVLPERVTAAHWTRTLLGRCRALASAAEFTLPGSWFHPVLPRGTAFDPEVRAFAPSLVERVSPEELDLLAAQWPRSVAGVDARVRRAEGRAATVAEIRGAWPEADQNQHALRVMLSRAVGDEEKLGLLGRLCTIQAESCLSYGNLIARSDPVAAAAALERGIAQARDRVMVGNSTYWLVDHYLGQGREEDALRVAALSAATYSYTGLLTQARVFERLGRLAEAEAGYRRLRDRYEGDALDCFYLRQARRAPDGPYASQGRKALESLFPYGLNSRSASELSPRRVSGAGPVFRLDAGRFRSEGYEAIGAALGDEIRTVYGFEVSTADQYTCARSLVDSDELQLVVQRRFELLELRGPFLRVQYGPVPARERATPPR